MNRILLFCALGLMLGCRPAAEPTTEAITLSYVTSEQSKTDALTAGDEVAVFARIEGTEHYFLEAAKFVTGSDGHTLSTSPVAYYPETKQAVAFFAYFPYHTGVFSVPSDQSSATALKQADLCWASTKSTPVGVVPLSFEHQMARLVITTNEPTAKIACSVVPSGVLNAATAEFSLSSSKSDVFTTGDELILPAQPLSRLVLTVSGVDYLFDNLITLEAGKTTSLNLILNPSTKSATLNGSSTTDWTSSTQQGNPTQAVSNILTLHWANYVPQGATPDKVILTIGGTDYTVNSGITYANKTFTVPFASEKLRYPYTISKITFYNGSTQALPSCTQLLGPTIYKSAASTLGIKDPANAVLIDRGGYKLWWATGNLISDGNGGCKIGEPTDIGLLFCSGGLIAYRNGERGDGTGGWVSAVPNIFSPIAVPKEYTKSTTFPGPYLDDATLSGSEDPATGIGDPCKYYLQGGWRMATWTELSFQFTGSANYPNLTPLPGAKTDLWPDPTVPNLCHAFGGLLTLRLSCHNSGDSRWTYGWYFPGDHYGLRFVRACRSLNVVIRDWDPANGEYAFQTNFTNNYSAMPVRCVAE